MNRMKRRLLSLLLAGIVVGQAAMPVFATETADTPEESTETVGEDAESENSADDVAEEATTSADSESTENAGNSAELATEHPVETSLAEVIVEPVEDSAEEDVATAKEESEADVMVLSDDNAISNDGEIIAKTYGVDYFDADYASGYFCLSNGVAYGLSSAGGGEYHVSNTSKSADIYMDYYDGVMMDGEYYDVRQYVWMVPGTTVCKIGSNGNPVSEFGGMHMEWHFYKSGTLNSDNPEEVSFRGVMRFIDCDGGEGFSFEQGLVGVWLYPGSRVQKISNTKWIGTTRNNEEPDAERKEHEYTIDAFWTEVEGGPDAPLTMTHWSTESGYATTVNYTGNSITYKIVSGDIIEDDPYLKTACATYGYYNLLSPASYRHHVFSGWYYDEELTEKVPNTIPITEDQVFYGSYTQVEGDIQTEVVGGTITDSIQDVSFGSNVTIEYSPNEGCFLDTVTVDGKEVDPDEFKDEYQFLDIQDDHTISVVYVKAEEPVKSVADANGKDMNGQFIKSGETLVYTISVKNPASTTKTFKITDTLPDGIEFISADHNGKESNGVVTWNLEMPAGGSEAVVVKAKATKKGASYANTAEVKVGDLTIKTNEVTGWTPADPVKTVTDVDGNDVNGEFLVAGETVTYKIKVQNPADEVKTFQITDKVPSGMEVVSISHDGKNTNGTITWNVRISAGAEETVRFQAKATTVGAHVVNTADVTVENITRTTNQVENWIKEKPVENTETTTTTETSTTTETHKTINNVTENNKVINNTTENNTTENDPVQDVAKTAPTETTTSTGYRNVNTGDMARTGLMLAIAAAAAVGLGIYYYKNRG